MSVALVRYVIALENSLLEAYSSAFSCSNLEQEGGERPAIHETNGKKANESDGTTFSLIYGYHKGKMDSFINQEITENMAHSF